MYGDLNVIDGEKKLSGMFGSIPNLFYNRFKKSEQGLWIMKKNLSEVNY